MMLGFPVSRSTLPGHPWVDDFFTGNVSSNRPKDMEEAGGGVEALMTECNKLSDENQVLKRCLRLLQDNTSLETTTMLSAVVAFCDGQFRRKFADGLEGLIQAEERSAKESVESAVPFTSHQRTQTHKQSYSSAATGISDDALPSQAFQDAEQAARASSEEEPVRDVPASEEGVRKVTPESLIHEVPERDGSVKKKRKGPKLPVCPRICPKSPHVSLGGRQIRPTDTTPYFYPSEPTSKHLQSHMQTRTAFTSDLEYDALYLRSLALAAGYRALAKELREGATPGVGDDSGGGAGKAYKYVSLDKLCRHVSGIPPYIMYKKNKRITPARLIHTCVCPKPTRLYPFSREGHSHSASQSMKGSDKARKLNMKQLNYATNERANFSPLAQPLDQRGPGQAKVSAGKKKGKNGSGGKDSDYDFQAVVTPIIDQARQSLHQVTGVEPTADQLTSFSLQHTHKEYQYKDDGTALVQSDVYKKSYNWSSDEEGGKGEKAAEGGGSGQEVIEIAQGASEEAASNPPVVDTSNNRTNNYLSSNNKTNNHPSLQGDRQNATSQRLEDSCGAVGHDRDLVCGAVSRDRDWANHCSLTSPFCAVTPRHSTYGSSHDLLQGRDRRLFTMDSVREADRERQPRFPSPKSWGSSWSKEADSTSAVACWIPSPRLDYFPVSQASGSKHDQSQWLAAVPGVGSNNLLGEVAFQLERRILDYVFTNSLPDLNLGPAPSTPSPGPDRRRDIAADRRRRLFGYSISNIGEMINQEALAGERYSRGTERMLRERLRTMLDLLTPMGYDLLEHGAFSQDIINKYGLLSTPPAVELTDKQTGQVSEVGLPGLSVADVQNFIFTSSESPEERDALLLIFDCLRMLAIEDGRPLFVW